MKTITKIQGVVEFNALTSINRKNEFDFYCAQLLLKQKYELKEITKHEMNRMEKENREKFKPVLF